MSTTPEAAEVPLNDRVAAVTTVLCDGKLKLIVRDPFTAQLPPVAPGLPSIHLRCFPFEDAGTTVVEISCPIAHGVPAESAIDNWALRSAPGLFNVYIVRADTANADIGSVIVARSSILATRLTVPVLKTAVDILSMTVPMLVLEFNGLFGAKTTDDPPSTVTRLAPAPPPSGAMAEPATVDPTGPVSARAAGFAPGYL